jgi:hypothetical protein
MRCYRARHAIHYDHYWLLCFPDWVLAVTSRHLVAKQDKMGKKYPWILPTSIPSILFSHFGFPALCILTLVPLLCVSSLWFSCSAYPHFGSSAVHILTLVLLLCVSSLWFFCSAYPHFGSPALRILTLVPLLCVSSLWFSCSVYPHFGSPALRILTLVSLLCVSWTALDWFWIMSKCIQNFGITTIVPLVSVTRELDQMWFIGP